MSAPSFDNSTLFNENIERVRSPMQMINNRNINNKNYLKRRQLTAEIEVRYFFMLFD